MRTLLFAFVLAAWSCSPPCVPVNTPAPLQGACRPGAAIVPDAGFALQGRTQSGTCQVSVDGGQLDLVVNSASCSLANGAADIAAPIVSCAIPALPAGTYTVNSNPPLTFTIPESADAGVPPCF